MGLKELPDGFIADLWDLRDCALQGNGACDSFTGSPHR
jgi:hypothetical protein